MDCSGGTPSRHFRGRFWLKLQSSRHAFPHCCFPLSQSARETKAASHVLQTVWSYKELRNALTKDGWNKSHFQVLTESSCRVRPPRAIWSLRLFIVMFWSMRHKNSGITVPLKRIGDIMSRTSLCEIIRAESPTMLYDAVFTCSASSLSPQWQPPLKQPRTASRATMTPLYPWWRRTKVCVCVYVERTKWAGYGRKDSRGSQQNENPEFIPADGWYLRFYQAGAKPKMFKSACQYVALKMTVCGSQSWTLDDINLKKKKEAPEHLICSF